MLARSADVGMRIVGPLVAVAIAIVFGLAVPASALAQPAPEGPDRQPTVDVSEWVGLPKGARPVVLTWERAYALAVLRSQAGRGAPLAPTLDPTAVDGAFDRLVRGDFAGFRKRFLAADGSFRDPSADLLDLSRRLQTLENAQRSLAAREALKSILAELIRGESSGVSQLQLDMADLVLQQSRRAFFDEREEFQNRLDALKVALGLAPGAAVVPDREHLAPFRAVFEAADAWLRDPKRTLDVLPDLAFRLPASGDVVIGGLSLRAQALASEPGSPEALFEAAAKVAAESRGVPLDRLDPDLVVRIRRRVRSLIGTSLAYELERREFVLVQRIRDQAHERLIAPTPAESAAQRTNRIQDLLAAEDQILTVSNLLVSLWTRSQAERLALQRDLGTLPDGDWSTFRARLTPTPRPVAARPSPPPGAPAPDAPPLPDVAVPAQPKPPGATIPRSRDRR